MAKIMTTKEMAAYLKFHELTICKYASEGRIPAIRIGRVWRFDKEVIDKWITEGQNNQKFETKSTEDQKQQRKKRTGKQRR